MTSTDPNRVESGRTSATLRLSVSAVVVPCAGGLAVANGPARLLSERVANRAVPAPPPEGAGPTPPGAAGGQKCEVENGPSSVVDVVCQIFDTAVGGTTTLGAPLVLVPHRDSLIIHELSLGSMSGNDSLMLSLLDLWRTAMGETEGEVKVITFDLPLVPDLLEEQIAGAHGIRLNGSYDAPRVEYGE